MCAQFLEDVQRAEPAGRMLNRAFSPRWGFRMPNRIRRLMLFVTAIGFLHGLRPHAAIAQGRDSSVMERRVSQIVALLGGARIGFDTLFAQAFLAEVPPAQVRQLTRQLATQLGTVTRVQRVQGPSDTPTHGEFRIGFSKGFTLPMTIDVVATRPNLVGGLLFGAPSKEVASIEEVMHALAALPGHVSALAARLDGGIVVQIAGLDTGRALGIGSAFKLYVLSELIREIESGERHWSDVVSLDSASRSLPSGVLQNWPAGTPITIESLAILMISQSDNSAADRLLHLLGRERVENQQRVVGNSHSARNVPFLTTRELFALKTPADSVLLRRYLAGSISVRRDLLTEIARQPYAAVAPDFSTGPVAIDSVEWFASASDLARTMLWIRDHTTTGAAAVARDVLAVNPGLNWPSGSWPYVGFKGGSEPGVLDLSFLLRRADGRWFVLTATWVNAGKVIDEDQIIPLMQRAGELLLTQKP